MGASNVVDLDYTNNVIFGIHYIKKYIYLSILVTK